MKSEFPWLVGAALAIVFLSPATLAATPAEVEAAIQKARDYLFTAQRNGIWDPAARPAGRDSLHWGGTTALATYALLAEGESRQDAKMKKAIEFLSTADIDGIYALGLRAQMWRYLPKAEAQKGFKKDGDLLLASMKTQGNPKGMFNYPVNDGPSGRYDHSVSQYGVLGLWAVAQLGYEVPTGAWLVMDHAWREHQTDEGAWEYIYKDPKERGARASMTAAGVATLFITQDYINAGKGADCKGNIRDQAIEKGLAWMSANYKTGAGRSSLYTMYGIERIGVASGYKYFGTTDWYDDGADFLVRTQENDGSWGGVPDTCFAMLFLVRGRAPVVMNKLEYEIDTAGDKAKLANWNQRPRDCAHLVHWMSGELERDLNWQIVNLKVDVDELHDAPILYIAGNQNLSFTKEQEKKLKQFVEQGGMIVGNSDCMSEIFNKSFMALGQRLFPAYEFRDLPKDHLIFTQPYNRSKWKNTPVVRSMTNGAREMMLLIPTADLSRLWQLGVYAGREEGHQLMWNLYFYAVDKKDMRYKGQTYIVHASSQIKASQSIKVARIEYAGNWNPEPGGWRRLNNVMHNHSGTDVDVKTIKAGSGELLSGFKVAHLTGTTRFRLDAAAQDELKKFIEAGGTLIIDACGGSPDFATSAEELIAAICPDTKPELLKPDHPALAAATKADVQYRAFAKKTVGNLKTPRIKGYASQNRTAVFFSAEDLSTGLVGMSLDGIYGYEPKSATDLMRAMVTYAGASSAPSTAPWKAAK